MRMQVIVYGKPKGWDRSGQNGRFHYDTKKNTEMKAVIRVAAQTEAEKRGIQLPITSGDYGYSISIISSFLPPKSYSKKRLEGIKEGKERPRCKPDIDNIAKLWLDALVSGGIIEDDKNVARITASKCFGNSDFTFCEIKWRGPDTEGENG